MTLVYLVQHGEKEGMPGDPGLTTLGRQQAAMTAGWLRGAGLQVLYSSPLKRARETAGCIGAATGLMVRLDGRLRERMNWDGSCPAEDFLAEWARATRDRDYVPRGGDSSHQAAERLRAFLTALPPSADPVGAVTHGGVTIDLLRTLLTDEALPAGLLDAGVPPCAITTVKDLTVVAIAATGHLA